MINVSIAGLGGGNIFFQSHKSKTPLVFVNNLEQEIKILRFNF